MDSNIVHPAPPSASHDAPRGPRPARTTAGRLLAALTASDPTLSQVLSEQLEVREQTLVDCRDGITRLEPGLQLQLARLALTIAPAHARLARQLQEQAEAALRYEQEGRNVRHLTYPKALFR